MDLIADAVANVFANPSILIAILGLVAAVFSARKASRSAVEARESAELAARALRTNANQYAAQLVIESSRIAIQYPEIAPYLNGDKPIDEEPHFEVQQRAKAAAEAQLDVMEAIWDHHSEFAEDDVESWREWMHHVLKNELHHETYDPAWYPSIRKMLVESGCSAPLGEHQWAIDSGAADGDGRLEDARHKLEAARKDIEKKGGNRAAAMILAKLTETHFRIVQSRQETQVAGLRRTTDNPLTEAAEKKLKEYRQSEVKFAAAAEWHAKARGRIGRVARLRVAALRAWLLRKLWEPSAGAEPRTLGDLMRDLAYRHEVNEGRKMRLTQAIDGALLAFSPPDPKQRTVGNQTSAVQPPPERGAVPVSAMVGVSEPKTPIA